MDIYNRSAERTVIEMNLSGIAIIIAESFQAVFNSDMLSMLGNIFPCFQPLQRLLRKAVSGVRNINVDILFVSAILRVNRHGNQRNRLQRQGMFCRILYKHLNQEREDYCVFHLFMNLKIIGEFFRIAQQQNFEVIFTVVRLRRYRHHLACIPENIRKIIGRNTAHRLCMVVLTEVDHAVDKVQTVHIKMRTDLDFQVVHLDFLFLQLLLIQRDLQPADLVNHVSEFIVNLLQLAPEEKITAMIPVKEYKQGKYLFMATRKGIVKKTPLLDYANVRKTGLAAISLREDDELIEVKLTNNKKDIFLVTKYGQCIRFPETDVRSMGRTAMGVIGMQLNDGDEVIGMQLNTQGDHLLIVSANGMGKLTSIDEFKSQNRGGKGVKCYKIMEKTGNVIGVKNLHMDDEIMMINTEGIVIRMMCSDISVLGRVTSGVKLMNLSENVSVASIAKVRETSADSEDIIKKIEDEMIEDEKNDEEIKNEETTQE